MVLSYVAIVLVKRLSGRAADLETLQVINRLRKQADREAMFKIVRHEIVLRRSALQLLCSLPGNQRNVLRLLFLRDDRPL